MTRAAPNPKINAPAAGKGPMMHAHRCWFRRTVIVVVAMTAAVAAGGCGGIGRGWSFGPSSTAGAGATTTTTELVTPSLQPAPAQRCAQLKAHQAVCLEWTPLEPQPSFADLVRLQQESRAPNGVAWGGLYLCGAVPEDLATRHLGGNYLKVVFTKHVCGLLNTAQTIDVQLYLGDPPLDSWLPSRPDTGAQGTGHPARPQRDPPNPGRQQA